MPSQTSCVCVVDDDADIRESLRIFLEDEGYTVLEAADGLHCLELLRASDELCVVLLDLMMPRLDGAGVLQQVAAEPQTLGRHAYIVITANRYSAPDEARRLTRQLHIPIVTKPFDLVAVLDAVERAMDRRG